MSSRPIIHVIDDDDAARQSLMFLLKSAKFSVEAHEGASAFLDKIRAGAPSVIITDIRMPGMTGIELLKHLKTAAVPAPVIVITGHGDVPMAVEAMKNGAFDFLEKPFDDGAMLNSVKSALADEASKGKREGERHDILNKLASLSTREREVLEGLVAGLPNKSIAYDLKISPRTVEIYRANAMTKMNANSLSHLVRMALVAGVLTPTV